MALEIEHTVPRAAGGRTEEDNFWLSCADCNSHKGTRTSAPDAFTGEIVPLFDPRHRRWSDHLAWVDGGVRIEGPTPTGRATVDALQLNRPVLNSARQAWVRAHLHPPDD
jgi:hypothetical protein